jgi:hypothetical protein
MREPDVDARFTVDGLWWLPDRPSAKLPGTLSLGGGRDIRLKLFGVLGDTSSDLSGRLRWFPIILGTSDREELCTLSDTYEMGRSAEPARQTVTTTELCANRLYIGKHFPTATDVQFTSVEVRFSNLDRWLGWRPVKQSFATSGVEWRVEEPDLCRKVFDFVDSARSVTVSVWSRLSEVISLARFGGDFDVYLRVAPPAPSSFEWFFDYLFDVRNLFTLFIGSPVYVETMTGFGNEVEYAPDARRPEEINIYFNTMSWPKGDPVYPTDMPVTFQLIRERTGEVFHAWFSSVQRLRLACELFFGALYNSQMYAASTFLNFAQALEVFHRVTQPGKYVPDEEYEGYRKALERAIPPEAPRRLRHKLEIVLRYGNERTLRDALRALTDSLGAGSRQRISTNLRGFVNKVVDTRNYLTHGDESLKGNALSDSSPEGLKEYIQVYRRLQAILTLHLLKFIGIPEAQVAPRVFRGL